jgi:hypothetical protein
MFKGCQRCATDSLANVVLLFLLLLLLQLLLPYPSKSALIQH